MPGCRVMHKYAAGDRYSKKTCVLDVRGGSGLINTFVSPRNLDTWGGFIRVTGIISVAAVFYVSCHVGLLPFMRLFRKNTLSFVIRYSEYFDCSDCRHICCVDGPHFGTYNVPLMVWWYPVV